MTITRIRQGAATGSYDEQGNPTYGAAVSSSLTVFAFAPAVSDEIVESFGAQVIDGGTLYDHSPIDLVKTDLVVINGDTYQVEGHVREWRSPYTPVADGDEVLVRRAD